MASIHILLNCNLLVHFCIGTFLHSCLGTFLHCFFGTSHKYLPLDKEFWNRRKYWETYFCIFLLVHFCIPVWERFCTSPAEHLQNIYVDHKRVGFHHNYFLLLHFFIGTFLQSCFGTFLHFSRGTSENEILSGIKIVHWLDLLLHCCFGTFLHSCFGTMLHFCFGTSTIRQLISCRQDI